MNPFELMDALVLAGIQTSGCTSSGIVFDTSGNEIQTRPDVAAIVAALNPSGVILPTVEERLAAVEEATMSLLLGF
jgi:hypothetical protein